MRSRAVDAVVAEAVWPGREVWKKETLYGLKLAVSRAPGRGDGHPRLRPGGDLLGGMACLVRRLLENTSQVGFLRQSRIDLDPDALLAPPAGARVSPGVAPG